MLPTQLRHCFTSAKCKSLHEWEKSLSSLYILRKEGPPYLRHGQPDLMGGIPDHGRMDGTR